MQHMVSQFVCVCSIVLVYFGLLWGLVLFLIDTVLVVVVCMAV